MFWKKLREAAQKNIVEVVSFHYSDQLFLAYPRLDMERSVALTKELFSDLCVPLSPVVFNQEGQAGEGRHTFMADHDYSIAVFPKNLFRYNPWRRRPAVSPLAPVHTARRGCGGWSRRR